MKWIFILASLCFIPNGYSFWSSLVKQTKYLLDHESCDENFIAPDFMKLQMNLKEKLFGQEIIIDKLVPMLESHFKNEPKKALVICLHGWTGSGKNYATQIVIDNIFKKKTDSKFVHFFNGRLHFPLEEHVDKYKMNIQNWIKGNVTNCPRSVFVFDEIDKMPAGIIDGVKPFFDYHPKVDSINYRQSIFIFISNIGGEVINSQFMDLWRQGKLREDMQYKDFEPYLRGALHKTEGAFRKSSIIEGHLVSLYLPFLPLEKKQVRMCITTEMMRQNPDSPVSEEDVNSVLEEMEFDSGGRFSVSGCKRVTDLVAANSVKLTYKHPDEL